MSSLFRARRAAQEGGSGGKTLRDRRGRRAIRTSPYARPPLLALPAPPPPAGSPSWLLGLVSGAGKLISSVFRSDSSSTESSASHSSSSSDYSSDQDRSPRSDEDENVGAPKMLTGPNQGLDNSDVVADRVEGSLAIVPISETKLAIEKLLSQETFSRDECERLTKLLQSRVVDSPLANRDLGNTIDSSGAWLYLKQSPDLPGSFPYSPGDPSPKTPTFSTPDVRNPAVMEAKKWLEEKKLTSNSKVDSALGPCTLNTHDLLDDASPVDLAKSYMQNLPPWQSPNFDNSTLTSTMDRRVNLFPERSNHATNSNSLPSFKEFKRKYLSVRSRKSPDSSDNKKPRLVDGQSEDYSFKQIDSQELIQRNISKISSEAVGNHDFLRTMQVSSSLPSAENFNAPAKSLTEHVEGHCSKDVNYSFDRTFNADQLTQPLADKSTPTTLTSEQNKTLKTSAVLPNKIALPMPAISTLESTVSDGPTDPNLPICLDSNKEVRNPLLTVQEDIVENDVPRESFISASTSTVPGGDSRDPLPHIEKVMETPDGDADDATNRENSFHTPGAIETAFWVDRANNSTELNLDSELNPLNMIPQPLRGTEGLANYEFSTNGVSESNHNPQPICLANKSSAQCSNGEQTAVTTELPTYAPLSVDPPAVQRMDNTNTKLQNGTTMKSIERAIVEAQPSSRNPKKRTAVRVRRGKGRGRGSK